MTVIMSLGLLHIAAYLVYQSLINKYFMIIFSLVGYQELFSKKGGLAPDERYQGVSIGSIYWNLISTEFVLTETIVIKRKNSNRSSLPRSARISLPHSLL